MAHYNVYWRAGKDGPPLASHWYTLGAIIVWASPVLEDWVGKRHADLEVWLREENGPWWAKPLSRRAHKLDDDCVPPTQKYHKQLMQCIAALVEEVPLKNPPCMTLTELARLKGVTVSALQKRARKVPYPCRHGVRREALQTGASQPDQQGKNLSSRRSAGVVRQDE